MVFIIDVNLNNNEYKLESKLIQNLSYTFDSYTGIKLLKQFNKNLINDFNKRNFNNNNINDILFNRFFRHRQKNRMCFVINNLEKTTP